MKRLISLLVLLFLMVGCVTPPQIHTVQPNYTEMTSKEIRDFIFVTNGVSVINQFQVVSDSIYAIPTLQWVKEIYSPELTFWLFENSLLTYHLEDNDCDDFSHYAVTVAHKMHRQTLNKPNGSCISIGEVYYVLPYSNHAINFFVVTDNGEFKLMFYEPMVQDFLPLDPESTIFIFLKM